MQAREYETVVLLDPDMGDDELNKFAQKFKTIVDAQGGKLLQINNWGKKKLAYPIEKLTQSIYLHLLYVGLPAVAIELDRTLGLSDEVVRQITIVLEKGIDMETKEAKELEPLKVIADVEPENKGMHEELASEFGGMADDYEGFEEDILS